MEKAAETCKTVYRRFFNRDISWLEFNARVLAEAARADVPLLERIKFCAIVFSNFEEFFTVRFADLKRRKLQYDKKYAQKRLKPVSGTEKIDISGLTVTQQLHLICKQAHKIYASEQKLVQNTLLPLLKKENIVYVPPKDFTDKDRVFCKRFFYTRILPFLKAVPLSSCVIENRKTYAAFLLRGNSASHACKQKIALIPIPPSIEHIVPLESSTGIYRFTLAENLIALFGTALFKDGAGERAADEEQECTANSIADGAARGYAANSAAADSGAPEPAAVQSLIFKTLGSASFCINKKNADLTDGEYIRAVEKTVLKRNTSPALTLICTTGAATLVRMLCAHLHLNKDDVYTTGTILNIGALTSFAKKKEFSRLTYPVWKSRKAAWSFTSGCASDGSTLWERIKQKDRLLHVPYESYNAVLNLLNRAADDERVTAIKITLYRTGGNSAVVKALEKAALSGKRVTVFIELKARFDELQNIRWARRLTKAGAAVFVKTADTPDIKVHAKILLIVRREKQNSVPYVYLSTGNFNEKTARLYSDISVCTANKTVGKDALLFFKYLCRKKSGSNLYLDNFLHHLYISPLNLKSKLLSLINRESALSTKEKPGLIMAKLNALEEPHIIEALYKASCSHVRIMLNVRGICLLVPGVKNQSEHIRVVSIIDRFLEHSRILYFQNGGNEEVYLSSADWMSRNTDRRIELLFEITQKDLLLRLKDTLLLYFKDNTHAHTLNADGTWSVKKKKPKESSVRAQKNLYTL